MEALFLHILPYTCQLKDMVSFLNPLQAVTFEFNGMKPEVEFSSTTAFNVRYSVVFRFIINEELFGKILIPMVTLFQWAFPQRNPLAHNNCMYALSITVTNLGSYQGIPMKHNYRKLYISHVMLR